MGKEPTSKPPHSPSAAAQPEKRFKPLLLGAVAVVLVGVALLAFWRGSDPAESVSASAAASSSASPATPEGASAPASTPAQRPEATPEAIAKAEARAKLGPRRQASLPPVPFQGYGTPRPPEVILAAYQFAAEHPEILSYVPCFCGCERAGHDGNHDCFVKERAANGDVVAWDEHGVECAVCIDVANRSRQMHASGATVRDIRAAIEKEFGPLSPVITPTPNPPAHNH